MSRRIAFAKGQGTGNDFILLADPEGELELGAREVSALCDRRFGIGADGLIRAVRTRSAGLNERATALLSASEWFMDYRNADGSLAEMCGNGIRVFARFLEEEGLAAAQPGGALPLGTRAGIVEVQRSPLGFTADLGAWRPGPDVTVRATHLSVPRPGLSIDVGNPHVVVALADAAELEALDLAAAPALDPEQPHGANVEFVVPEEPLVLDGVGRIRMRVHERGSGETLSCGTGAVAAALATRFWAGEGAPDDWQVDVPGGRLTVRVVDTEDGEHVALSGPAQIVYRGTIEL